MRSVSAVMVAAVAMAVWGCGGGGHIAGIDLDAGDHGMVSPDEVAWQPGPPSLPEGAEMAVLEGDPGEPGFFAVRLRLPDGYRIPPHWHPGTERVTVIQGTFHLGMSEEFDLDAAEALPAGSYFFMPPEMAHFAQVEGETIVQIATLGPWDVIYVDPADDPRQ